MHVHDNFTEGRMNSKQIATMIGTSIVMRKLAFFFIRMTTLREWYLNKAVRKTLKTFEKEFQFLDAGSGMGQHAIEVAEKYKKANVFAIELDVEQVEDCNVYAAKRNLQNVTFKQCDIQQCDFTQKYDTVFCSSVLEHVPDDISAMTRLYKSLKKGGTLITYVPTSEKRVLPLLERKMQKMLQAENKTLPHDHVRYYNKQQLTNRLQSVGFTINEATITYGTFGRIAYDIVTWVQYNRFFKIIFPFYFILVHPFVMLMMLADTYMQNKEGNGLMVIAQKC